MSETNKIIPESTHPNRPAGSPPSHFHLRFLGALPLPVFIGMVVVFNAAIPPAGQFDKSLAFEPLYLNAILYTVFLAFTSSIVAFIALKSYLKNGGPFLLLLGCGALAWGSTQLVAGWLTNLTNGPNPAITISNTGALLAAIFHVASGTANSHPSLQTSMKNRKPTVIFGYGIVLVFTIVYTVAALDGMTPPFFVPGLGQTFLRMIILGLAATLFGLSALLFARLYPRSKSATLYWYFLSLALTGAGLATVFFGRAPGDPISWTGRAAMFLGGAYLLKAIFFAFREHHV